MSKIRGTKSKLLRHPNLFNILLQSFSSCHCLLQLHLTDQYTGPPKLPSNLTFMQINGSPLRKHSWLLCQCHFLKYPSRHQYFVTYHAAVAAAKLLQSCTTLCDPIDGSPPGSPVPGTLQARTLEWVAISLSDA